MKKADKLADFLDAPRKGNVEKTVLEHDVANAAGAFLDFVYKNDTGRKHVYHKFHCRVIAFLKDLEMDPAARFGADGCEKTKLEY